MPLNPQSALFSVAPGVQLGNRGMLPDDHPRLWLLYSVTITPGVPSGWGDAINRTSLITGNEANSPGTWTSPDALAIRANAGHIIMLPIADPLAPDVVIDALRQDLIDNGYRSDVIASCFLSDLGSLPPSSSCDYALTDRFQSIIISIRPDPLTVAKMRAILPSMPSDCYSSLNIPFMVGDVTWVGWRLATSDLINRMHHPLITFMFLSEDYDYAATRLRGLLGIPNNTQVLIECVESG